MRRLSHVVSSACVLSLWSCGKSPEPSASAPAPAAPAAATSSQAAAPVAGQAPNGKPAETTTISPEQASQVADRLIAAGNYRQAASLLTQIINASPKQSAAYVKRAAIFAESRLLPQAIADMTKAIEFDSENARYRNTRGYFYLSTENLPLALQDFNDAIGLDINFSQPHNNRGLVRIAMNDVKTAVKEFDEALKIDANYLDAHNNRGYALMKLEQYDEAVAAFSRAIEINPKYVNAWNNRGRALLTAGRGEEALADFNEAIRLSPNNVGYFLGRAECYEALHRPAEAQADHEHVTWMRTLAVLTQQAIQNPTQPANWIARGKHYLEGNDPQAAAADFNRALQASPDSVEARCGRARSLLMLEKVDEAIVDCNVALARDAYPLAASIRGDCYFQKGDLDKAIQDYVLARRMDAQVAQAYLMRSKQRKAAGDVAQADSDLERALSLDPGISGAVRQASAEEPAKN